MQAVDDGYGVDGLAVVVEAAHRLEDGPVGGHVEIGGVEPVEHVIGRGRGTQQSTDHRLFGFCAVRRRRQPAPGHRLDGFGSCICESHDQVLPPK